MHSAENLIPHGRPMRVVDRVVQFDGESGIVEADITAENPFLNETGILEPVAFAELVAQGFAACKGYEDSLVGGPPKEGFLVAIKKVDIKGQASVGDTLQIAVKRDGDFAPFTMVSGVVSNGGTELAMVLLRVWMES